MDYTISREVNTDRLYAYAKNRFWYWNESMHDWKESHLMSQTYEKAHTADARLSPEDFMSDGSRFLPLDDFEVDYLMRLALKNAEPCKTVPIEPVEESLVPQEVVAKCDDRSPAASDAPFDFSSLGDLSGQASEADAQFDLHYGAAQDEYLISCIYLAKIHALTAKSGRYGGGTWTKWYESKGLSHGSVTKMVQNGEAFKSSTVDELKQLPELTRKDLNLIARSGCAEQLTEAAGDSQRVQELLAQIKAKDEALAAAEKRAEDAEAHEVEATDSRAEAWAQTEAAEQKYKQIQSSYNDIKEENQQLRTDRVNAMNEADRAKANLERANEAMQAAESARDAALADVQGLSEQNNRLKAENADLKKGVTVTAFIDEEEVDRRAAEKAWGLADARNAELQAEKNEVERRNAELEQQLAEALTANDVLTAQAQTSGHDPLEDGETTDSFCINLDSGWSMARPAYTRLVGTGEDFNLRASALYKLCDRIKSELVEMIKQNDKETLYD